MSVGVRNVTRFDATASNSSQRGVFFAARSAAIGALILPRFASPMGSAAVQSLRASPQVQFNLSYSSDQALLAVSRNGPLGVDLEARRPLLDLEGLALQVMDPVEQRAFRARVGARPISSVLCALDSEGGGA